MSDACRPEGQKIGDIFRAMRVQKQVREVKGGPRTSLTMEVGRGKDLDKAECKVRNLRTEVEVWVPWNTFLKVGGREVCGCAEIGKKQGILKEIIKCRCVYLDLARSEAWARGKS